MTVTYHVGDTREVVKGIADGSVDLIASSPPFLALRSYVPADHEHKGNEIGSEANPAAFIDMLLGLTAEWGRVLAAHGSLAIELGDTYSGNNQSGWERDSGDYRREVRSMASANGNLANTDRTLAGWPRAKSLALIPQLYAVALAYGINPLTGAPSPAGRWLVRNVIVWHRPNPAVGALGDKVRPSTSYIVVATRSPRRWFDLTAVRHELADSPGNRYVRKVSAGDIDGRANATVGIDRETNKITKDYQPSASAGAPPLDAWFDEYDGSHDTWTLTTQPSRLAHYAMWPAKLAERLILMMCPREVCRVCGEPRRRMEDRQAMADGAPSDGTYVGRLARVSGIREGEKLRATFSVNIETLGWTDCGHDRYRPGLVLDPFAGSGTTLAVADLHGRDAIGIDFDQRNHDLYPARYDEVKRALYGTPAPMPGQETFDFAI